MWTRVSAFGRFGKDKAEGTDVMGGGWAVAAYEQAGWCVTEVR